MLAGVAMMLRDLTVYRHDWDNEIRGEAQIIALATAPALAFDDHRLAARNLGALRANTAVLAAGLGEGLRLLAEYAQRLESRAASSDR